MTIAVLFQNRQDKLGMKSHVIVRFTPHRSDRALEALADSPVYRFLGWQRLGIKLSHVPSIPRAPRKRHSVLAKGTKGAPTNLEEPSAPGAGLALSTVRNAASLPSTSFSSLGMSSFYPLPSFRLVNRASGVPASKVGWGAPLPTAPLTEKFYFLTFQRPCVEMCYLQCWKYLRWKEWKQGK